jgi:stage II sporulation protein D
VCAEPLWLRGRDEAEKVLHLMPNPDSTAFAAPPRGRRLRGGFAAQVAVIVISALLCAPALALTLPAQPASGATPSAPPAPAAKKKQKKVTPRFVFTFEGRGYGHGIGMSQYGAYGAALAGWSAQRIIAYYYRGTTLAVLPVTPVRVLLATSAPSLALSADGEWGAVVENSPLQVVRPLPPNVELRVAPLGADGLVVRDPGGAELLRATGAVRFTPITPGATTRFKGTRYRGELRVTRETGGFSVVNRIDLEQYLTGVVPREMPAKWGDDAPAALEAQAIAARSYAMATRRSGGSFDMYADERSQVYGGASAEDPRTTRAVQATAGKVVTYQGTIVTTYFFSTSGGKTENVENVFRGSPEPYLVAVTDNTFDARSPHHVWRDPMTFTDARLAKLLGTKRPVLSLKVLERGASPRVKRLRVVTRSGGVKVMSGVEVRRALGLRDTWFSPKRRVLTKATLRLVTPAAP